MALIHKLFKLANPVHFQSYCITFGTWKLLDIENELSSTLFCRIKGQKIFEMPLNDQYDCVNIYLRLQTFTSVNCIFFYK